MAAHIDADRLQVNSTGSGGLAQMQRKVVVSDQVFGEPLASDVKIDRISTGDDFRSVAKPARQLDKRQPTGVFRPWIIRLKGGDQNGGHTLRVRFSKPKRGLAIGVVVPRAKLLYSLMTRARYF